MVQNPLKTFVPIKNKSKAINHVVRFPSLIAEKLLVNQSFTERTFHFQVFISSLTLSNISTFASTASQIVKIMAAIQLKERAYQSNFTNQSKRTKNESKLKIDTTHILNQ